METITLAHGTTLVNAQRALNEGILPRCDMDDDGKHGNWADCPSNDEGVYLTDSYAVHFAINAMPDSDNVHGTDQPAVIVADVYPDSLLADEDAVTQALQAREETDPREKLVKNLADTDLMLEYAEAGWDGAWSLKVLGTCQTVRSVDPRRIKRVVTWPREQCAMWVMSFFDPSISLMNYHIMGDWYRFTQALITEGDSAFPSEKLRLMYPAEQLIKARELILKDRLVVYES